MPGLSSVQRRELKARAHSLKPVVLIGASGLTPAVLAEIDRSLKSHELIKLRAAGTDRGAREALLAEICLRSGAHPVQRIGKIFVVFRENPELKARTASAAQRPKAAPRVRTATRSGRR
jgi:putative YhbY family RNA-binding protein